MARPTRKRKAISLETKYEIIQCVEMGNEPKKDVAARLDILSKYNFEKQRKNCGSAYDAVMLLETI
jgi:transposase-like protein